MSPDAENREYAKIIAEEVQVNSYYTTGMLERQDAQIEKLTNIVGELVQLLVDTKVLTSENIDEII